MNVLEEWIEKRERGSDGEIEIDKHHFGLSYSVSLVLLNAVMKDFWFWCIGIRRIFNIVFPM